MKATELKYLVEEAGHSPYFFDRKTMRFWGDTMKNYGVRSAVVDTWSENNIEVWELYRKHPVKHGVCSSAYFDKQTFKRVHPKV